MPDDPLPDIATQADQIHLRLIATTDVHVQIHPYDYYADRPAPATGLAHAAALIDRLRAAVPNSLLFDNGDILQGSPMGDYVAEVRGLAAETPHPAIAAMNALGYDAATIGNHEFNYGLDVLRLALSAARFPVTCANVVTHAAADPAEDTTLLPPFVVLTRTCRDGAGRTRTLRIGVIGVLPPQIMVWDRAHLQGRIHARDIVTSAAARLPQLRAAGADIVIALCHSGIGSAKAEEGMENASTALAALPGIDAVIAGHSHLVFPGPDIAAKPGIDPAAGTLAGKPAVMAGCFASHLGVIDLVLAPARGGWTVARAVSRALPVSAGAVMPRTPRGKALLAATRADHQATLVHIRRRVGRSAIPLTTFFAVLPGNAVLDLIARAQSWHVAQALSDTPFAAYPLLSAASPFKMGGRGGPGYYTDVPPGDLAVRHVADLYAYPNAICAVLVTGAELRGWIERASDVFRTLTPGAPNQMLVNPEAPSSHFDVIRGVTWSIDLSRPVGGSRGRIRDLSHGGRPVADGDRFVVATNSYRAGGGGGFPGTGGDSVIYQGDMPTRDVLRRFLEATGPVTGPVPANWRFAPLPGTTALYDSAPQAVAHLGTLKPLRVENTGPAPGGFARFRIHL